MVVTRSSLLGKCYKPESRDRKCTPWLFVFISYEVGAIDYYHFGIPYRWNGAEDKPTQSIHGLELAEDTGPKRLCNMSKCHFSGATEWIWFPSLLLPLGKRQKIYSIWSKTSVLLPPLGDRTGEVFLHWHLWLSLQSFIYVSHKPSDFSSVKGAIRMIDNIYMHI